MKFDPMLIFDPRPKVLVCGPRTWRNPLALRIVVRLIVLEFGSDVVLIHGAARGADTMAGEAGEREGIEVWDFPANWKKYGYAAGPIRNADMLALSPRLVVALGWGKGTFNTITQARDLGIPVMRRYVPV